MANAPTPKGPKRPAGLAHGRWLGDFPGLSAAERALVAACGRGEAWEPEGWDGKRPEMATPENTIRGELIRFLALAGDGEHPVHEKGVTVGGGWIDGELNLHQCRAPVRLALQLCHFESEPILVAAQLPELLLRGSKLPGLKGDRLDVKGSVSLNNDFTASGEVRLSGAQIGGDLDCSGGKFANQEGCALSADGIVSKGGVFLNKGFTANGEVRLLGARIGRELNCSGAEFAFLDGSALSADRIVVTGSVFLDDNFAANGEVRLVNAEISGNLTCSGGKFACPDRLALNAQGIAVSGGVVLRQAQIIGAIHLTTARIGTLLDDAGCWQAGEHVLDGLHYARIIGAIDATSRIAWLKQQREDHLTTDFRPQPWEQLIKVLREMGHPHEASVVAIAKQYQMRVAGKIKGGRARGDALALWKIGGLWPSPDMDGLLDDCGVAVLRGGV